MPNVTLFFTLGRWRWPCYCICHKTLGRLSHFKSKIRQSFDKTENRREHHSHVCSNLRVRSRMGASSQGLQARQREEAGVAAVMGTGTGTGTGTGQWPHSVQGNGLIRYRAMASFGTGTRTGTRTGPVPGQGQCQYPDRASASTRASTSTHVPRYHARVPRYHARPRTPPTVYSSVTLPDTVSPCSPVPCGIDTFERLGAVPGWSFLRVMHFRAWETWPGYMGHCQLVKDRA